MYILISGKPVFSGVPAITMQEPVDKQIAMKEINMIIIDFITSKT